MFKRLHLFNLLGDFRDFVVINLHIFFHHHPTRHKVSRGCASGYIKSAVNGHGYSLFKLLLPETIDCLR